MDWTEEIQAELDGILENHIKETTQKLNVELVRELVDVKEEEKIKVVELMDVVEVNEVTEVIEEIIAVSVEKTKVKRKKKQTEEKAIESTEATEVIEVVEELAPNNTEIKKAKKRKQKTEVVESTESTESTDITDITEEVANEKKKTKKKKKITTTTVEKIKEEESTESTDITESTEVVEDVAIEMKKTKKKKKTTEAEAEGDKSKTGKKKKVKDVTEKKENEVVQEENVKNVENKKKKKVEDVIENEVVQEEENFENKKKKKDKNEKKDETNDKSKLKPNNYSRYDSDTKQVLDYLISQNRPYSTINLYDNLHGSIPKKKLERILENLTKDGELICKEYMSKVYLASQKNFPEIDQEELRQINEQTLVTKETITELKEKSAVLQAELRSINTALTDEELDRQINLYKTDVDKLQHSLKMWQEGKIQIIPDDKVDLAEKEYEKNKIKYKKIKKICNEIIDTMCEGMEMKRAEIITHIPGFEDDQEAFALLKNKLI